MKKTVKFNIVKDTITKPSQKVKKLPKRKTHKCSSPKKKKKSRKSVKKTTAKKSSAKQEAGVRT